MSNRKGMLKMGMFVNPDNSAFRVALNSEIYVDKSGLIEYTNNVLNTLQGYICNSRPRRFGKSVTANMLAAYYSRGCDSESMFADLEIGHSSDFKKHLNKYDVIHLDIQWCIEPSGGPEHIVDYISEKTIAELKEYYPDVVNGKNESLPETLSHINAATGKKFIVIIDEWDAIIRDEAADVNVQEKYINFLRGMFKGTEPTKYIQLAYLTGILPIKKQKTQSALNNFDEFTMLGAGRLAPYIGFTEDEVLKLASKYHQNFDEIKKWYDGYQLNDYHIYNPRAVVSIMLRGEFKSYWSETASYDTIVPLINMDYDGLKTSIMEMLSGVEASVNTATFKNDTLSIANRDDVLTYMIHLGYLGYNQKTKSAFIPNEEIRLELTAAAESRKWNEMLEFQQDSEALLNATLDMDGEAAAEQIEKIHNEYASVIRYHDENSLSSVLAVAYLGAMQYYFKPVRELPTGRGFADFVFIPKPEYISTYPAMVVELKWNKSAATAMQQIRERRYPDSIAHYTGDILLVGISYDKKSKVHECLIEKLNK